MKLNKVVSLMLAFSMMFASLTVYAEEAIGLITAGRTSSARAGAVEQTPIENIFEYEGKKFIILDKEEKGEKTYFFVLCDDVYGTHVYDTSSRSNDECLAYWEPNDEYNMAAWLNGEFWSNGNGEFALPDDIKTYIDVNRVWHTEPMKSLENYTTERMTTHPLALLADYEWKEYTDKIGQNVTERWFFRTARTRDTATSNSVLLTGSAFALGTNNAWRANGSACSIRPCFWLDADFFKNCKAEYIGRNVAMEIDEFCNGNLYTDDEKEMYFPSGEITGLEILGESVVGETLTINYSYEGDFEEENSVYKWYMLDTIDGEYTPIMKADGTQENNKELYVSNELEGKYVTVSVIPGSKSKVNPYGAEVFLETPIGYIFGQTQINSAIQAVLDASPENIFNMLESGNVVFDLDLVLSDFDESSRANVALILSKLNFELSISALKSAYKQAIGLEKLNKVTDVSLIDECLNSEELGLKIDRYKDLTTKDSITSAVFMKGFNDFSEFERIFYQTTAIQDVKEADRTTIKTVLLEQDKYFVANIAGLTDYQLGLAGSDIINGSYTTFEELDSLVSTSVEKYKDAKAPNTSSGSSRPSGGGSSGGSSSGGSGGIVLSPAITPSYNDNKIHIETRDEEVVPTEQPKTITFDDISDVEWAKESIIALADKKIISGDGNGKFRPNDILTREEFVKMVVVAFMNDVEGKGQLEFADVDSNAWYAQYIDVAYSEGVISGVSELNFGIGSSLTREDMVVILYRLIKEKETVEAKEFSDNESIADYAKEAVGYMAAVGVINGTDGNRFEPKGESTRAMAAKVLYNMMQLFK